ncbi:MAG: UvrD-helicase domain-containing protein [Heliobacteriaceae bacterium]|jgi:DNA helicase-2/ATP-dependent DNA helicase PcrA|nr:UvrD-helicase domain-containing protein [Heliobacteriaceae bacterium]
MEDILNNLNKEQCEAVKTVSGALLILAGAGSGKTKVLTSRIAYLIKNGVRPRDILAVTFTNKAAKEMKERLGIILGENTVKYMWVGTFHGICGRILRENIESYAFQSGKHLDRNFTIYDEADSVAVIKQAVRKLNLDEKIYAPKLIKTIISNAKNKMQDAYTFATFSRDFRSQKIAAVFEEYENTLNNNNAIDFDDMLLLTVKLLEQNAEVREYYHDRFKHILVDEYQDTNLAQYMLVNMLYTNNKTLTPALSQGERESDRSLCVVGDVDQSIYSWRGADYTIILNFQKDFKNAKLIKLEQNYRSTANILNVANAIIENNTERVEKVLFSEKGAGELIDYFEAQDEADEANFIASKIRQDSGGNYNRYAVLYRTNSQSRALEEALMAAGIPYRIYGGLKFYDRKEIKDIIAYLRLIYNADDSQSFRRIVNVPKRAIGDVTIKALAEFADSRDRSLFGAIEIIDESELSQKVQSKLKDFAELILKFREAVKTHELRDFVTLVIEKTGYLAELQLQNTPEAEADIENLQELVNVAGEFEPEEIDNVLGEFLQTVALVSDIDGLENISNNVTLMTLHSAKGLEYPEVFLAGCDEGVFPHQRTFASSKELEEERRLMYVGVTRAEEKLYLLSAKRRQMWGEYKYYNPSRFIDEIPQQLLNMICFEGSTSGSSTFQNAVSKARTGQSDYSYSAVRTDSDGYVKPSAGFGKGFTAPGQKSPPAPPLTRGANAAPQRTILVKSKENKQRDEEKVAEFFKDNAIKRMLAEKKQKDQDELLAKQERERKLQETQPIEYVFNEGERVFHEKLGVGHITEVTQIGESLMYTIDFGKLGKKAMDAAYARLKKF